jgi:hypothetical protein
MTSGWLVALVVEVASALVLSAPAGAQPQYNDGSADDLEADGYNVVINWLTGYDTKPLSVCWVSNVNNPGSWDLAPGGFTTVYVDVSCPNHEYG